MDACVESPLRLQPVVSAQSAVFFEVQSKSSKIDSFLIHPRIKLRVGLQQASLKRSSPGNPASAGFGLIQPGDSFPGDRESSKIPT